MTTPPKMIPITQIAVNPFNPRKTFEEETLAELAASIRQHGFLGVLEGRQVDGHVELAYGARRLAAALQAGLTEIPVIIHPNWSDEKMQEIALVENLQREDLSPVEEAEAIAELIERHGYTHDRAGQVLGKSQAYITQRLTLLRLHPEARDALAGGEIGATQARDLGAIPAEHQPTMLKAIAGLSTRKSQNLIQAVAAALTDGTRWSIPEERRVEMSYIEERLAELIAWRYQHLNDPASWMIALRERSQLKPLVDLAYIARQDYEARNILGQEPTEAWEAFAAEHHPAWTCATCLFRERRALLEHVDSCYTRHCRDRASICILYLDTTPANIPLARWRLSRALEGKVNLQARIHRTASGRIYALDLDTLDILAQEEAAAQEKQQARSNRSKAEETQEVVALYQEMLAIAAVDHPLAQPCSRCLHGKVDPSSPQKACEYGNGGLQSYERLDLFVWTRDGALLIPRCSRFEYKDLEAVPETDHRFTAGGEALVRLMAERVLEHLSYGSQHGCHPASHLVKVMGGGKELIRKLDIAKLTTLIHDRLMQERLQQVRYGYMRETQSAKRLFDPSDGQAHEWQAKQFQGSEESADSDSEDIDF